MRSEYAASETWSAGRPVVQILTSFPVACFTFALGTDIAYTQTANMLWSDFSDWLLAVGMFVGVLAGFAGLISLIAHRRTRRLASVWPVVLGCLLVFVIGLVDNLVHSRDAWTSVMPLGLILSALLVIVTLGTVWLAAQPDRLQPAMPYAGGRP